MLYNIVNLLKLSSITVVNCLLLWFIYTIKGRRTVLLIDGLLSDFRLISISV